MEPSADYYIGYLHSVISSHDDEKKLIKEPFNQLIKEIEENGIKFLYNDVSDLISKLEKNKTKIFRQTH